MILLLPGRVTPRAGVAAISLAVSGAVDRAGLEGLLPQLIIIPTTKANDVNKISFIAVP